MKACCGFNFPWAMAIKSSSSMENVASAVPTLPFVKLPIKEGMNDY